MSNHLLPDCGITRRAFIAGAGAFLSVRAATAASELPVAVMQLGWVLGANQIGEIVAQHHGYFANEGLALEIAPGGPNNDGVSSVASGSADIGQVTSSPSLMLAISEDLPVRSFAVLTRRHPYAFFSLPERPIRRPVEFMGKRVGVPATGRVLVEAMLLKNGISRDRVEVITIGSDMTPLLNGQVDAVSGWVTDRAAINVLGSDVVTLELWNCGVHLYGMPYYAATTTIDTHPHLLEAFLRAAAKGWERVFHRPDEAVEILVSRFPSLSATDERAATGTLLRYVFDDQTLRGGFGTMSRARWQEQLDLYDTLGQFTNRVPGTEDIMTLRILDATAGSRPCLG
ncbi:nitrate ABC transporter substrate-binding protein [Acetobacter musti]|uniref:Thiamine pyrimidine synthase n=1 Tax=Acetobacter musti TaxID=864732 RepID=A0ABX0JTV3_9PROT|nr:ABC transporter substrate-binding protein [Acetobacter musti]NHN86777.1 nitrate ABC transporter substrate-binding protein [Acetobacter musti]